jgi:hypothetical protein
MPWLAIGTTPFLTMFLIKNYFSYSALQSHLYFSRGTICLEKFGRLVYLFWLIFQDRANENSVGVVYTPYNVSIYVRIYKQAFVNKSTYNAAHEILCTYLWLDFRQFSFFEGQWGYIRCNRIHFSEERENCPVQRRIKDSLSKRLGCSLYSKNKIIFSLAPSLTY